MDLRFQRRFTDTEEGNMKIIRFLDDGGNTCYGAQQDDGTATLLDGDIDGFLDAYLRWRVRAD